MRKPVIFFHLRCLISENSQGSLDFRNEAFFLFLKDLQKEGLPLNFFSYSNDQLPVGLRERRRWEEIKDNKNFEIRFSTVFRDKDKIKKQKPLFFRKDLIFSVTDTSHLIGKAKNFLPLFITDHDELIKALEQNDIDYIRVDPAGMISKIDEVDPGEFNRIAVASDLDETTILKSAIWNAVIVGKESVEVNPFWLELVSELARYSDEKSVEFFQITARTKWDQKALDQRYHQRVTKAEANFRKSSPNGLSANVIVFLERHKKYLRLGFASTLHQSAQAQLPGGIDNYPIYYTELTKSGLCKLSFLFNLYKDQQSEQSPDLLILIDDNEGELSSKESEKAIKNLAALGIQVLRYQVARDNNLEQDYQQKFDGFIARCKQEGSSGVGLFKKQKIEGEDREASKKYDCFSLNSSSFQ